MNNCEQARGSAAGWLRRRRTPPLRGARLKAGGRSAPRTLAAGWARPPTREAAEARARRACPGRRRRRRSRQRARRPAQDGRADGGSPRARRREEGPRICSGRRKGPEFPVSRIRRPRGRSRRLRWRGPKALHNERGGRRPTEANQRNSRTRGRVGPLRFRHRHQRPPSSAKGTVNEEPFEPGAAAS